MFFLGLFRWTWSQQSMDRSVKHRRRMCFHQLSLIDTFSGLTATEVGDGRSCEAGLAPKKKILSWKFCFFLILYIYICDIYIYVILCDHYVINIHHWSFNHQVFFLKNIDLKWKWIRFLSAAPGLWASGGVPVPRHWSPRCRGIGCSFGWFGGECRYP
jgi:hypothetical protein